MVLYKSFSAQIYKSICFILFLYLSCFIIPENGPPIFPWIPELSGIFFPYIYGALFPLHMHHSVLSGMLLFLPFWCV